MNKAELFDLRRTGERNFKGAGELRGFLETLLGKEFILPMVVGYANFQDTDWEIQNLHPLATADRLTVENYLEGLKQLENEKQETAGRVTFQGVENLHYSNWDSAILFARIAGILNHKVNNSQVFRLVLYFSTTDDKDSERKGIGYRAMSEVTEPEISRICQRFVGPNREYRRVLI